MDERMSRKLGLTPGMERAIADALKQYERTVSGPMGKLAASYQAQFASIQQQVGQMAEALASTHAQTVQTMVSTQAFQQGLKGTFDQFDRAAQLSAGSEAQFLRLGEAVRLAQIALAPSASTMAALQRAAGEQQATWARLFQADRRLLTPVHRQIEDAIAEAVGPDDTDGTASSPPDDAPQTFLGVPTGVLDELLEATMGGLSTDDIDTLVGRLQGDDAELENVAGEMAERFEAAVPPLTDDSTDPANAYRAEHLAIVGVLALVLLLYLGPFLIVSGPSIAVGAARALAFDYALIRPFLTLTNLNTVGTTASIVSLVLAWKQAKAERSS